MSSIHELDEGWIGASARRAPTPREREEFYQSRRWHEIRDNAQRRDGYVCRICREKRAVDGHHLTYERWGGGEEPKDILSLCRECHGKVHGKTEDPDDRVKNKESVERGFNNHLAEIDLCGGFCGCEGCFHFWREHQKINYGSFVV